VTGAPASPTEPVGPTGGRWERLKAYRARHAVAEGALFFLAGFLIDVFTLSRIDDWLNILQQGVYLTVLGTLLLFELRIWMGKGEPPRFLQRYWRFSEDAIHFLFGSLLSVYALLFLKSASDLVSFGFLVFLFGLLVANELPQFRRLGPALRLALFSFCVTAYFAYLVPVLVGFIRPWLFFLSVLLASIPLLFFGRRVLAWGVPPREVMRRALLPGLSVNGLLLLLYLVKAIPPVPLSVQYIGIYHDIQKGPEGYQLMRLRPDWKFWENGDQTFEARPGDRIFCFVRVFAPTRFRDRVQVRWSFHDPKRGWTKWDAIPLNISGGRSEGFRGYAFKENYQPGDWRVDIETEDGRDVGSIRFTVTPDETETPRLYNVDPG
jgi:hypothetical protein